MRKATSYYYISSTFVIDFDLRLGWMHAMYTFPWLWSGAGGIEILIEMPFKAFNCLWCTCCIILDMTMEVRDQIPVSEWGSSNQQVTSILARRLNPYLLSGDSIHPRIDSDAETQGSCKYLSQDHGPLDAVIRLTTYGVQCLCPKWHRSLKHVQPNKWRTAQVVISPVVFLRGWKEND